MPSCDPLCYIHDRFALEDRPDFPDGFSDGSSDGAAAEDPSRSSLRMPFRRCTRLCMRCRSSSRSESSFHSRCFAGLLLRNRAVTEGECTGGREATCAHLNSDDLDDGAFDMDERRPRLLARPPLPNEIVVFFITDGGRRAGASSVAQRRLAADVAMPTEDRIVTRPAVRSGVGIGIRSEHLQRFVVVVAAVIGQGRRIDPVLVAFDLERHGRLRRTRLRLSQNDDASGNRSPARGVSHTCAFRPVACVGGTLTDMSWRRCWCPARLAILRGHGH